MPRTAFLALLVLSACATAPGDPGDPQRQLRALVEPDLRRAGISQGCIDSLDAAALTQAYGLTMSQPRSSREVLIQRQRLRSTVGAYYCAEL